MPRLLDASKLLIAKLCVESAPHGQCHALKKRGLSHLGEDQDQIANHDYGREMSRGEGDKVFPLS